MLDDNPPTPTPSVEAENEPVKEAEDVKKNTNDDDGDDNANKKSSSSLLSKKRKQQQESQARRETADPGISDDLEPVATSNEEVQSAHRRRKALNPSQSSSSHRSRESKKDDGNDEGANDAEVPSSSHRHRTALNPSKSSSSTRSNTSVRSANSARSSTSAKSNSSSKDQQHDGGPAGDDDSFVYRRRRVVVPSNSMKFQKKVEAATGGSVSHAAGSSAANSSPTHSIMKTSKADPTTTTSTTNGNHFEEKRRQQKANHEERNSSNNTTNGRKSTQHADHEEADSTARRDNKDSSARDGPSSSGKKTKKKSTEDRKDRQTHPSKNDDNDDGADADDDDEAPSMPRRRAMTPTNSSSRNKAEKPIATSKSGKSAVVSEAANKKDAMEHERPGTSSEASHDTTMAMPRRSLRSQKSDEMEAVAAMERQGSNEDVGDDPSDVAVSAPKRPEKAVVPGSRPKDNDGNGDNGKGEDEYQESAVEDGKVSTEPSTQQSSSLTTATTNEPIANNSADGNLGESSQEAIIRYIYTGEDEDVPDNVQHVIFDPTVTYIPEGAFSEHKTLSSIEVPSSVTEIGSQAFANCEQLSSVTLSEGLQVISEFAFTGCTKLQLIHIPSTVIALGQDCFFSCDHLASVTLPLAQPEFQNIRVNTFRRCKQLSEIKIPSSVKIVGNNAFDGCVSLNKVEFGGSDDGDSCSLELIGKESFIYCEALTSISVPSSVKEISKEAFFHCTSLKEVTFSASGQLSKIGMNVFGSCTSLESLKIPPSLVEIGESAFAGCESLANVELPKADVNGDSGKLSVIGFKAFSSCKSLSMIEIPATVTSIGEQTFYDCESLHTVILPNSPNGPQAIQHFTFRACKVLTHIEIPQSVIAIGPEAFYECDALKTVKFSYGLRTIGESAFGACKGLTTIELPSSLEELGKEAFFECINLTSVTLNKGLLAIGESAFGKCKKLQFIDIPTSVEVIDKEAFVECEGLQSVKFRKGLKVIASKAFRCCKALTSADLPSSLEELHGTAFAECDSLVAVILPPKLDRIEKNVFRVCRNLMSIEIPPLVTEIASNAFYKCECLETLYLPEGLQVIGKAAFKSCKALTTTEYPSTIAEVEESAFSGCSMLEKLPDMDFGRRFDGLPLHRLCYHAETNVIQFRGALEENVDAVDAKDMFGMTAMHVLVSCFNGSMEIFNVLLDAFPKAVSTKDSRGRCPIHMAWNRRLWRTHVINALCTSDSLAPDSDGNLPLDMAIRHDMPIHLQVHMFSLFPIHPSQLTQQECIPLLTKVREKYIADMLKSPPASIDAFHRDKQHGWVKFVSGGFFEDSPDDISKLVEFVNDEGKCSKQILEALAYAKDRAGRQAIDFAHDEIKKAFQQRLLFLGRYKLSERHNQESGAGTDCNPVHRSENCLVLFATDTFKARDDEYHEVALKFTKAEDQLHREIHNRIISETETPHAESDITPEIWRFDDKYVVPLLRFHKRNITIANQNYIGCLVMPRGGRNLHQIIEAEGIAGADLAKIVVIAKDVAETLQYLHSNSVIHGDFKPRNIVRFADRMKLIDFNASVAMSLEGPGNLLTSRCSSAYIPPEVAHARLTTIDSVELLEQKLQEFDKIRYSSPILWKEGLAEKYEEVNSLLQWLRNEEKGSLEAKPCIDIWAFGVILYFLLTGKHLIPCDTQDNLVDDADKRCLLSWTGVKEQHLRLVLCNCAGATEGDKAEAQEVLRVCLEPKSSKRPMMDEVLNLVFFSKRNLEALRMLETTDEVARSQEDFAELASKLKLAMDKPPEFFMDSKGIKFPYLFSIVSESEFIRQRDYQSSGDSERGGLSSAVSDSLGRAARFVSFARRVLSSGQRDGATIDWLYERVYDDAAGRVVKVSYLQILCGLTLRPVITYKIDSKQHAPMLTKMAEWSGHVCAAAVQVASFFNTRAGIPRVFGYPLSSIGDDKVAEVVAFRERILDSFPVEELDKWGEQGSLLLELEEIHNFIRDLEAESRVCQLFDDYNLDNLHSKKWEDGLELGYVLEGVETRRIPTYVSKQYSKRMGGLDTIIVPSDVEDAAKNPAFEPLGRLYSASVQTSAYQEEDERADSPFEDRILEEQEGDMGALVEEPSDDTGLEERVEDIDAVTEEAHQMPLTDDQLEEDRLVELGADDRGDSPFNVLHLTKVDSSVHPCTSPVHDGLQQTFANGPDSIANVLEGTGDFSECTDVRDISSQSRKLDDFHAVEQIVENNGESTDPICPTELSVSQDYRESDGNHNEPTVSPTIEAVADETDDGSTPKQNSSFDGTSDGEIISSSQPQQTHSDVRSPQARDLVVEKKINDSPGAYTNRTFSDETPHPGLELLREDIKQMLRSEVEAMQDEIISSFRKDMKAMGSKAPMTDTSCKCKASCVIL